MQIVSNQGIKSLHEMDNLILANTYIFSDECKIQ